MIYVSGMDSLESAQRRSDRDRELLFGAVRKVGPEILDPILDFPQVFHRQNA